MPSLPRAEAGARLSRGFGGLAATWAFEEIGGRLWFRGMAGTSGNTPPVPAPAIRHSGLTVAAVGRLTGGGSAPLASAVPIESCLSTELAIAWSKHRAEIVTQVAGDWVAAIWCDRSQSLCLARSPNGSQALFFDLDNAQPSFASLPQALAALAAKAPTPDWQAIAFYLQHMAAPQNRTGFAGIQRLRAGHVVQWRGGEWTDQQVWRPRLTPCRAPHATLAATLRAEAERAVAEALPPVGPITCQLSAGRDSSVVTALAARLAPGRITAVTFRPIQGGAGADTNALIFDEARIARRTASHFGVPHVTVDGGSSENHLQWLRQLQSSSCWPLLSANGASLRMAMARAAAETGSSTMLVGALGNLGLSLGGLPFLAEYRREEGLGRWLAAARALSAQVPLRTLVSQSAPTPLRHLYQDLRRRQAHKVPACWAGPLAAAAAPRPFWFGTAATAREETVNVLDEMEMSDLSPQRFFGVELRDPLADRQLIETCLRLPATGLVGGKGGRPLYEEAFADLLPDWLLSERRKGRQAADWWKAFDPEQLGDAISRSRRHPLIDEVVNAGAVARLIGRWPRSFEEALLREAEMQELLGTLSLCFFLEENFCKA